MASHGGYDTFDSLRHAVTVRRVALVGRGVFRVRRQMLGRLHHVTGPVNDIPPRLRDRSLGLASLQQNKIEPYNTYY